MRFFFKTAGPGSVPLFCLLVHLCSHRRFSAFQRSCLSATSISFVIGARHVIRRESEDADTSGSAARDRGPTDSGTNNSSSATTTTAQEDPQQATSIVPSETPDKNATALHSTRERHTEIGAGRGADIATGANTSTSPSTPQRLHERNVTGDAVKLVDSSPGSLLPRNFSTGESLFLADEDVDYVQRPKEEATAAKGPGPLVAEVRGEDRGKQAQIATPELPSAVPMRTNHDHEHSASAGERTKSPGREVAEAGNASGAGHISSTNDESSLLVKYEYSAPRCHLEWGNWFGWHAERNNCLGNPCWREDGQWQAWEEDSGIGYPGEESTDQCGYGQPRTWTGRRQYTTEYSCIKQICVNLGFGTVCSGGDECDAGKPFTRQRPSWGKYVNKVCEYDDCRCETFNPYCGSDHLLNGAHACGLRTHCTAANCCRKKCAFATCRTTDGIPAAEYHIKDSGTCLDHSCANNNANHVQCCALNEPCQASLCADFTSLKDQATRPMYCETRECVSNENQNRAHCCEDNESCKDMKCNTVSRRGWLHKSNIEDDNLRCNAKSCDASDSSADLEHCCVEGCKRPVDSDRYYGFDIANWDDLREQEQLYPKSTSDFQASSKVGCSTTHYEDHSVSEVVKCTGSGAELELNPKKCLELCSSSGTVCNSNQLPASGAYCNTHRCENTENSHCCREKCTEIDCPALPHFDPGVDTAIPGGWFQTYDEAAVCVEASCDPAKDTDVESCCKKGCYGPPEADRVPYNIAGNDWYTQVLKKTYFDTANSAKVGEHSEWVNDSDWSCSPHYHGTPEFKCPRSGEVLQVRGCHPTCRCTADLGDDRALGNPESPWGVDGSGFSESRYRKAVDGKIIDVGTCPAPGSSKGRQFCGTCKPGYGRLLSHKPGGELREFLQHYIPVEVSNKMQADNVAVKDEVRCWAVCAEQVQCGVDADAKTNSPGNWADPWAP
ncbi:unnamed protein product, partial [Amoebophrya sp. A120]|eukprot:GSA120T00004191001.1